MWVSGNGVAVSNTRPGSTTTQLSQGEAHGPYGLAEDLMQIPSGSSSVLRDHIIVIRSAIGHVVNISSNCM